MHPLPVRDSAKHYSHSLYHGACAHDGVAACKYTLALYDSNGKPLELPAGRSYIALLSSLTGQELLVQSSTGEALVGA